MRVEVFSNNLLQVNTYFLIQDDNSCLVIDPGNNVKELMKIIDKKKLNVVGVVLTHAHFDHFLGCNEINLIFSVPLFVHSKSLELLKDPEKNVSSFIPQLKPLVLDDRIEIITINEETKQILNFPVHIYHVPGHSPDSIGLYFKNDSILFSGDALFKNSIGRTDFYYGNEKQLLTNIKNKLFRLPDDTLVYPGHGEKTTIGSEKKYNPYIK